MKKVLYYVVHILLITSVYGILGYIFDFKGHLKDPISFMVFLPINYFVGVMGWKYFGVNLGIKNKVYWIIFWFIAFSYVPGKIIDWFFPDNIIASLLIYLDTYWFTSREYFLIIFVVSLIIGFIMKKTGHSGNRLKKFLIGTPYVGIILLIVIVTYFSYGTWNSRNTVITPYDITINKKAGNINDLNAVMLSDIHLGRVINNKRLKTMVKEINSLKPDIVLITGDCIEDDYEPYIRQNMADTLRGINSKFGVYAVLGNHDMAMGNAKRNINNLENAGIRVLKDQYIKINDAFYLVGRSDRGEAGENSGRLKLPDIIKGLDKSMPAILMDHQPVEFDAAAKNGMDIQLSGHTHNGQDLIGKFMLSLSNKLSYGMLKDNSFYAIVSSGFGTWGSPLRIGTNSEIVNIHIKFI